MKFNPEVHTKEYLLKYLDTLHALAKNSEEFGSSKLAQDFDILSVVFDTTSNTTAHVLCQNHHDWFKSNAAQELRVLSLKDKKGLTLAHDLARYEEEWLETPKAKCFDVLSLRDNNGNTVAHTLAMCQKKWIHSNECLDKNILKLSNSYGVTVAHNILHSQITRDFLNTPACQSKEILKLVDSTGNSVAHNLVLFNAELAINHEPLYDKNILSLYHRSAGKILAEMLHFVCSKKEPRKISYFAMPMIAQGAAYKHSAIIPASEGNEILAETKMLIEDSADHIVAFKIAQALYSTFSHNMDKAKSGYTKAVMQKNQKLLNQAEEIVRNLFLKDPTIEIEPDIYCEPAQELIKKLAAENNFKQIEIVHDNEMMASPTKPTLY